MKNQNSECMTTRLAQFALAMGLAFLLPATSSANESDPAAVAFGTFPTLWGVNLSPDGKKMTYLSMHGSDLPIAGVFDLETQSSKILMASEQNRFDVTSCQWANNERVLCSFSGNYKDGFTIYTVTRLVAINTDGSEMKVLLQGQLSATWSQFQDRIIDMLPDDPKHILIEMPDKEGKGVSRLNIYSGRTRKVEKANRRVLNWITDGSGNIRVRQKSNERKAQWEGRTAGSKKWQELHNQKLEDLSQLYLPAGFGENPNELLVWKDFDGKTTLWTEDLSGEAPDRLVFAHPEVDLAGLHRVGKNQRIAAVAYMMDRRHLHFFDRKLKSIHERLVPLFPDREITLLDESWDGRFYLVRMSSDLSPGTFYRFDSEKNDLLRLFDQYPKLKGLRLNPMQSIEYSARDGMTIPAYLTEPTTKDEGPQPTVILPHGGPHSRDIQGYDWLAQYFSARGYLVMQMNYRGSSGFGSDWMGLGGWRNWRTVIDDISDGARYLVETGRADAQRMCIVGWSFGGYAAQLSGIEEPDLYRCVVSIAGVSDLPDLIKERKKFQNWRADQEFIGRDPKILKLGSPARRAMEMKPPTLLFHGDEDINTRISQSEKMNNALKKANKDVTFIEYEEAEHSLWRNSFRIDMLERTGKFLDQHTRPTETSSGEANPGAASASQFDTETVAFPSNG